MGSGTVETLRDVWGSSENDVYAVGDYGTVIHYDGTTWSPVTSGTTLDLFGIWGSSKNNIFAVGREGLILRYKEGSDDNNTDTCPFLVSLDSTDDIKLLRDFRDTRLKNNPGIDLTSLFYSHGIEVARILKNNDSLQHRLRNLVRDNREVIKVLITGETTGISEQGVQNVVNFLQAVKEKGTLKLRITLEVVLHGIQNKWLLNQLGMYVE